MWEKIIIQRMYNNVLLERLPKVTIPSSVSVERPRTRLSVPYTLGLIVFTLGACCHCRKKNIGGATEVTLILNLHFATSSIYLLSLVQLLHQFLFFLTMQLSLELLPPLIKAQLSMKLKETKKAENHSGINILPLMK